MLFRSRPSPRLASVPLGIGAAALLSLVSAGPGGAPALAADAAAAIACNPDNGGITLPEGLCALVFADDLGRARHLAVRDNGDVYVMLREPVDGRGVVALRDTTGDGRADVVERFGDFAGTGIGISDGHLYVAPNDRVLRFALGDEELVPEEEPELIAHGFPQQRGHAAKPFALDGDGHIYVNVGAPSNSCERELRTAGSPGQDPCPELERQAGIWRFAADQPDQTQEEHGELYASGIRNAVALDWNEAVGALYLVQHGRDQLDAFWPDFYDEEQNAELPSEEFLRVEEPGQTFAWPYCSHDPFQGRHVLAPEYGGDGQEVGRCEEFPDPIMALPAHWAPNDLLFYTGDLLGERYGGGAFVAFHGSWNRAPLEQRGYKVVFVPFGDDGRPSGDWEEFADGFAGERPIRDSDEAEHRPMGLAEGPDGSLYISDSQRGRIWRVIRSES